MQRVALTEVRFHPDQVLRRPDLDRAKLRLAFVVYGGINRVDWRTVTVDNVRTTAKDVDAQLVPMLRSDVRPAKGEVATWTDHLVRETRDLMTALLPSKKRELFPARPRTREPGGEKRADRLLLMARDFA